MIALQVTAYFVVFSKYAIQTHSTGWTTLAANTLFAYKFKSLSGQFTKHWKLYRKRIASPGKLVPKHQKKKWNEIHGTIARCLVITFKQHAHMIRYRQNCKLPIWNWKFNSFISAFFWVYMTCFSWDVTFFLNEIVLLQRYRRLFFTKHILRSQELFSILSLLLVAFSRKYLMNLAKNQT